MFRKNSLFNYIFILSILTITAFPGCSSVEGKREYPCCRLAAEPVIDGILENDPAWEIIPFETGFVTPFINNLNMNYPAQKKSSFKMGFTQENLYAAFECREPWIIHLGRQRKTDGNVMSQDGIELYLQPAGAEGYFRFVMNANGTCWSGYGPAGQEIPADGWEAKAHIGEKVYSIEVRIPFSLLKNTPSDKDIWAGNIERKVITIVCPEDWSTGWAPVNTDFKEPESFGRFVFKDMKLTKTDAIGIEKQLAAVSEGINRKKEEAEKRNRQNNEKKIKQYEKKVKSSSLGFTGITKTPADIITPPNVPEGEVWRYGLGFPFQISPTEAGLFVNIRMEGSGNIDFEIGSDLILFDDMDKITTDRAIALSRYERIKDKGKGSLIVRKGPVLGGFVPLGARLADGSPHPHAGTGFGSCWAISHKMDENGKYYYLDFVERYAELFQFAYDGKDFRITKKEKLTGHQFVPGRDILGHFVTNAIPDGKGLLDVFTARDGDKIITGVGRWEYGKSGWKPVSFIQVTPDEQIWSEPSLIRQADGSLLFSARSSDRTVPVIAFDMAVWKSADNGETWNQVIYEKNIRSRSPVSINCTVDGTPFIAANIPAMRREREVLGIWPLNDSSTGFECMFTGRDAKTGFGPAPSGSWWRIDHPNSAIIRLADGKWHSVLSYRIVDNGEVEGTAEPAPQTGCYVEEVFSAGKPVTYWNFEEK